MTKTLREEAPLIFAGLKTGAAFNQDLIDLECERIAMLANPPGGLADRHGGVPPRCAGRDQEAEGFHRAELRSAVRW
jgi:hypothetical protein